MQGAVCITGHRGCNRNSMDSKIEYDIYRSTLIIETRPLRIECWPQFLEIWFKHPWNAVHRKIFMKCNIVTRKITSASLRISALVNSLVFFYISFQIRNDSHHPYETCFSRITYLVKVIECSASNFDFKHKSFHRGILQINIQKSIHFSLGGTARNVQFRSASITSLTSRLTQRKWAKSSDENRRTNFYKKTSCLHREEEYNEPDRLPAFLRHASKQRGGNYKKNDARQRIWNVNWRAARISSLWNQ